MGFRIVILGSGRGSNARALLEAERADRLQGAEIVGVLSDKKDAGILEHGRAFEKESIHVPYGKKKEQPCLDQLEQWAPDLVILAGFMRIIGDQFLARWEGKIINLHPSLLPSFKGLDGIGQAWRAGVKVTGCTVHWVNAELDGGEIIDQQAVRVEENDTLESLEEKINAAEHVLLVSVVAQLSAAS
ncbi:MAG: phosphoribosylglycinamide formyltransferase [Opitutales bacterium]|nr:phosphoribosylglycinamide formyltransferase [Opitutales bacterium]